jgi:hypothetical protein
MATIIDTDNPNPNRAVLVESGDSSAGWAVAVVVLIVVVLAGAFWYMRYYRPASTYNTPGSTIQVNLPSSGYAPASGNTGSTQTQTQTPAPAPTTRY